MKRIMMIGLHGNQRFPGHIKLFLILSCVFLVLTSFGFAEPCPGNPTIETCDGIDNNCDGVVDEGCDKDGDGYCDSGMTIVIGSNLSITCQYTDTIDEETINASVDCDDNNPNINPGESEICNGIDDDCTNFIDEGCDKDGDGYCDADISIIVGSNLSLTCNKTNTTNTGSVSSTSDCDDNNMSINPDAQEFCDGVDNNCNGLIDEGLDGVNNSLWKTYYLDSDGDGYGSDSVSYFGCYTLGYSEVGGDCDDSDPNIYPGATEICNLKDDDCNGLIDNEDGISCSGKSGDIPIQSAYDALSHYFYTTNDNPQNITLAYGETQTLTYRVYAPGPYNSNHNIFAYAKMGGQTVARSNSVEVGIHRKCNEKYQNVSADTWSNVINTCEALGQGWNLTFIENSTERDYISSLYSGDYWTGYLISEAPIKTPKCAYAASLESYKPLSIDTDLNCFVDFAELSLVPGICEDSSWECAYS